MIQKTVTKRRVQALVSTKADVTYWLSKTPEERVVTVDYLRHQYYGNAARLQGVARVVQRSPR